MEQNACAECGFTTADLDQFTRHVERHERAGGGGGGCASRKSSKAEAQNEFQNLLGLSGDDAAAMSFGHLADLSRFLSFNHHQQEQNDRSARSVSPMDLSSAGEKRLKIEEEEEEMQDDLGNEGEEEQKPKIGRPKSFKSGGSSGGKGKTTHKCPHCTFTTYMSQHMKSHLRAHENFIGQMYVCDVCGMAFSQKANMHRHRGTHSGVKPYECRFCQKRFFRKDQMQEHSMTHIKTGDDFDCPVSGCECKFSQHSLLRQHLDDRHAISATQQAHCKRCTLQFANSRRLLLHYQTKHDEYYSAVSPVPDGHSPVKRLNGSSSSVPGLPHHLPDTSSSPMSADQPKRKSRKRHRKPEAAAGRRAEAEDDGEHGEQQQREDGAVQGDEGRPRVVRQASGGPAGGYNVEELLKLDCTNAGGTPASMTMPPAAVPNGFELFRDHLLRNTTTPMFSPATFAPLHQLAQKDQQNQAAQAAAAAHLFMQSLLMAPTVSQHHLRGHSMPAEEAPKSPKHLPLAKSPDCKGLVLNGFNKSTRATSPSSTPPPPAASSTIQVHEEDEEDDEEEASESEAKIEPTKSSALKTEPGEEDIGRSSREEEAPSGLKPPSAHSSTSHSPSSSSASSSNQPITDHSTSSTSSAPMATTTNGGTSTAENSPLKALHHKLFSSALLGRALSAADTGSGDMDCTHCGLLFSDQTLYLLHKGLHSEADPWRCNLCGQFCADKYTFTTHMISSDHS